MTHATIRQLLAAKDSVLYSVRGSDTVREAVHLMNDRHVGALTVLNGETCKLNGIFTERDVLARVMARKRDPDKVRVEEVMTGSVHVISPEVTVEHAMSIMTKHRCRHLPVVTPTGLLGMISIGDLTRWVSLAHQREADYLRDYLVGAPATTV